MSEQELPQLDPHHTVESTELLPKQCQAAWNEADNLAVPPHASDITNIVFCGMGGSIYGALVLKALLSKKLPFPTEVVSDYFLPGYVGKHTLVVLTSYSGSTQEVLSCAQEAKTKGAQMAVLTKGGVLEAFAKENNLPAYIFDGALNPSGVPRLGSGYTILGLLGLLHTMEVISLETKAIEQALAFLHKKLAEIKQNAAIHHKLFRNKIPIVFAAQHLAGNAQILRNQFNETSKTFSSYFLIPDLNHHLMEGLAFPKKAPLLFIILNSGNYSEVIRKRVALTMDALKQNGCEVHEFMTGGQTIYDDFLETLQYGSFLTLELALTYGQNPALNPWVDWFKAKLTE